MSHVDTDTAETRVPTERSNTYVAANVVLRGATLLSKFLLVVFLARLLTTEEVGIYGLVSSALAVSIYVIGLEYHYFTIRRLVGISGLDRAVMIRDHAILLGLVCLLALPILAAAILSSGWETLPSGYLLWFLALVVLELFAHEAGIALIAVSLTIQANLVMFVRSAIWAAPVLVAMALSSEYRSLNPVFAAWCAGAVGSIFVAGWFLRRLPWRATLSQPVRWETIRTGIRTAAPFFVITGASMGLLFADRFIIQAFQGTRAVGVYTFFVSISFSLHTLVNAGVSLVRVPRLVAAHASGAREKFSAELWSMARLTLVSTLILAAGLAVAIVPVVGFVGNVAYRDNVSVFFLLLVAAAVRSVADVPLYGLYAQGRDVALLRINVIAFMVSVITNIMLVPSLSIHGAALGAVAGSGALLAFAAIAGSRGTGGRGTLTDAHGEPVIG